MRYFSYEADCHFSNLLCSSWGPYVSYIELGDDQFVNRQVYEFENGRILLYTRAHWNDQYGMMVARRFSRKGKTVREFENYSFLQAEEFSAIWERHVSVADVREQLALPLVYSDRPWLQEN